MDSDDIGPFYDSVDSGRVLKGDCIAYIRKLAVFKDHEIILFREGL